VRGGGGAITGDVWVIVNSDFIWSTLLLATATGRPSHM
jgi:hypothetical protein